MVSEEDPSFTGTNNLQPIAETECEIFGVKVLSNLLGDCLGSCFFLVSCKFNRIRNYLCN